MLMKSLKYFLIILVSPASNEMYLLPEGFLGVFFLSHPLKRKEELKLVRMNRKR